jgi:Fe-S-cluster-containing dehydrogenase component/DMSO reductase anchor subunit
VLTAVERFSTRHDGDRLPAFGPYRALLPATEPGPGQQYAFEVDLDACTGCKACVTACHTMNGLDAGESWRSVGLLIGTDEPYQQTVTAACHHCAEPACMSGCPVDAYEKDAVTGIVHHLDDQCIGCRYCTLTCPYEVPRFNSRLGIVRKCDLCAPRLAAGEAPACAQGCPNEAIRVTVVDRGAAPAWPIPASPAPALTSPTTVYRTDRPIPDALPADHFEVRPAAAHDPLALMLVLSQLAVGAYLAAPRHSLAALGASLAALGSSLAHLGRPHLAWKAVIGLRHSWVSREIVALSLFTGLAGLSAALLLSSGTVPAPLVALTGATGAAGVGCSAAIYAATRRPWWSLGRLLARFAFTIVTCGLGVASVAGATGAAVAIAAVTVVRAGLAAVGLRHRRRPHTELGRTAILLTGQLWPVARTRLVLGAAGGVVGAMLVLATGSRPLALVMLAVLVAGEHVERTLLFTASTAPRMPGGRR